MTVAPIFFLSSGSLLTFHTLEEGGESGKRGIVYSYLGQRPEVPHVYPPRRHIWLIDPPSCRHILADGERAVVGPRHPRVVLVLCGADVYQSSVERRQARVADVIPVRMESLRWLNPTISQRRRARRVREDDRVDDRADAGRGLAECRRQFRGNLRPQWRRRARL